MSIVIVKDTIQDILRYVDKHTLLDEFIAKVT